MDFDRRAHSRLIVSWYVGHRDAESAEIFMPDVAARLKNAVQLTTDGLNAYLDAVETAFEGKIDYAQLVKLYGTAEKEGKIDNRGQYIGADRTVVCGNPNVKNVSTIYVERQNLTMHMRRFTRKTNAFSKKLENHCHMLAIYFVYYNFVKIIRHLGLLQRWEQA